MNIFNFFFSAIRSFFSNSISTASIQPPVVDDSNSQDWQSFTSNPHDYDQSKIVELYTDSLSSWRKNPIAWRIIGITTDYVVGDNITISSPSRLLRKFIVSFWNHHKNHMGLRLDSMCDELSRAGDLFVILFRNPIDQMSYIRFVTKDRIVSIETSPNDYETELAYYESSPIGEPIKWLSPNHPDSSASNSIMLHYSINRPIGALMGESDLTSMLPWLLRYSRMLEDRVRLHWAVRSFLWLVTVPAQKIREKQQQYSHPPEAGAIIVKDEAEQWEVVAPSLNSVDAQADLKAVRGMIDAGSGYPPHWRGDSGDANLATATAMQAPTERHLQRRQKYFLFMLQDIIYNAFIRSTSSPVLEQDYQKLFTFVLPPVSRTDNESTSRAAKSLSETYSTLISSSPSSSPTLSKLFTSLILSACGEPQSNDVLDSINDELFPSNTVNQPITPPI